MRKVISIGLNTIQGFSNPVFNFLIAIFGIKFFGKEDWGTLINVLLWVFFIVFLIGFGNKEYLIRKFSKSPSDMNRDFYFNFFSRSLLLPLSLVFFFYLSFQEALFSVFLVILIHCYNSLGSLVVYQQKFGLQFVADTLGSLIIIGGVFYFKKFDTLLFLKIYCLAYATRLLYLISGLKLWKENVFLQVSHREIIKMWPFFTIGFSGWVVSKLDIYLVGYYLPKEILSEYQLLITAFLMLQALSAFITVPFTKHIYRLPDSTVVKIQKKIYLLAIPLVVTGSFAIWVLMEKIVKLNLDFEYYFLGCIIALPSYYYVLDVIKLLKTHEEKKIILINSFGGVLNLILIFIFIEPYGMYGVLISVCISQWSILLLYKSIKKLKFFVSVKQI